MEYSEMIVQAKQLKQECNGAEMMKEWITRTTDGTESYRENDGQGSHNKVVHEGVKLMTAEVWKEFITREAESNGKNEDMRRFREGTRTLSYSTKGT